MGLAAVEVSLTAQKAWFFFHDQIVCLGNEIKSSDNRPIETIVENVKLHGDGDYVFVVNGSAQPKELGWSADLKDVKWAHLAGKVPGTDVGWWFPGGAELKALREARTGKWTDSFVKDAESAPNTRNFLTLWYDHGPNPAGATYAYVILPGRSVEASKAYAEKPEIEIVENSPKAQSVKSAALGVTGANFWSADRHSSAGITSSGKAAVLLHEINGQISVGIADPTQLESVIELEFATGVQQTLEKDDRVEVVSTNPLKLKVDVSKADGKTIQARFKK
jgi:hyaluronate lyase